MRPFLREPLLHFFLLGAAIFGVYAVLDESPPARAENVLVVTDDDARRLVAEFEATWRRPPTPEELDHMIGQYIREEVYVREALALGLDQDDAVIRRRLQQKMEFLTESGAGAVNPEDATLQAHLEANRDRFVEPPLIAFEQVLLPDGTDGGDAAAILARLREGDDPGTYARSTMLPSTVRPSPPRAVDGTFGMGVFDVLAALSVGEWSGPVDTAFGSHLVRVTELREGRLPPLEEIRDRVESDWRAGIAVELREGRFEALLSRYVVDRPDAAVVLGQ